MMRSSFNETLIVRGNHRIVIKELPEGTALKKTIYRNKNDEECDVCAGTGYINKLKCSNCNGEGTYNRIEAIILEIVYEGPTLRYKNMIHEQHRNKTQKLNPRKKNLWISAMKHISQNGVPKCNICGIDEIRLLEIDHIHNDGAEERKKGLVGTKFYNHILSLNPIEAQKKLSGALHTP